MLTRNFIKLYVERHSNREGSRIRTKLVLGALALTFTPVVFLVIFSINVLNRNIDKWFTRPAEDIRLDLIAVGNAIERESQDKAAALGDWFASLPETERARQRRSQVANTFQQLCADRGVAEVRVPAGIALYAKWTRKASRRSKHQRGDIVLLTIVPVDLARTQAEIRDAISRYDQLAVDKRAMRRSYLLLLTLITLFILFFATWIALFLAKQISVPISALLGAAQEVRKGNLDHRVEVNAIDELASLVRAFNEMTQELEANSRELDKRRRFTEAILESIPTGVISLSADGRIQRVNRALQGSSSRRRRWSARRGFEDLFSAEDAAEIRYLMKRARRTGVAASQFEIRDGQAGAASGRHRVARSRTRSTSGFVLVLEDTSDLLRAQKAAAWHEVARRIAHEIKNPLTPIALCAERIARQLDRIRCSAGQRTAFCASARAIIAREVEIGARRWSTNSRSSRASRAAQPVAIRSERSGARARSRCSADGWTASTFEAASRPDCRR